MELLAHRCWLLHTPQCYKNSPENPGAQQGHCFLCTGAPRRGGGGTSAAVISTLSSFLPGLSLCFHSSLSRVSVVEHLSLEAEPPMSPSEPRRSPDAKSLLTTWSCRSTEIRAERSPAQLQDDDQQCCAKLSNSWLSKLFSTWPGAFSEEWHRVRSYF